MGLRRCCCKRTRADGGNPPGGISVGPPGGGSDFSPAAGGLGTDSSSPEGVPGSGPGPLRPRISAVVAAPFRPGRAGSGLENGLSEAISLAWIVCPSRTGWLAGARERDKLLSRKVGSGTGCRSAPKLSRAGSSDPATSDSGSSEASAASIFSRILRAFFSSSRVFFSRSTGTAGGIRRTPADWRAWISARTKNGNR